MKIIITGCAGFIGSHLTEFLLSKNYEIIGIDAFIDNYDVNQKKNNLKGFIDKITFYNKNILDMDISSIVPEEEEFVIYHLAALPGVRTSWGKKFENYTKNNILATQYLLESVKDRKNLKRFVYASSSSIYGNALKYPTSEDTVPNPISPYGLTKLSGEYLIKLYNENYGLPYTIFRFFTVYGPRQRPDMAFHIFMKAILNNQPITVLGDGSQTRDFTYVEDIITPLYLSMENENALNTIFNIGGGHRIDLMSVIKMIFDIAGKETRIVYKEKSKGDVKDTSADVSLLMEKLNYKPKWELKDGLRKEWEWVKG